MRRWWTSGSPDRPGRRAGYILRGAALYALSFAGLLLMIWVIFVLGLCFLGVGIPLMPSALGALHRLVDLERRLALAWSGVRIPGPYRRPPEFQSGFAGRWQRTQWLVADCATWRAAIWAMFDSYTTALLALVPAMLVTGGLFGLVLPFVWRPGTTVWAGSFYAFIPLTSKFNAITAAVAGAALLVAAPLVAPPLVRVYARLTSRWLRPTDNEWLARRVQDLTRSRSSAVDTSAAELRRIERDLHDGAQVRLVAMGMTLSAAEQLLEDNPQAVRALLTEAKANSEKALAELRDLVRGIHPPVLADRGLTDAVRTLALECPIAVEVTADLPIRPAAPVESAAYFTVSELLNNVVKHAHASRAGVLIRHADGALRIEVTDDGCGGADPARGSGLRGVEERLATFDGYLSVVSPPGGPTLVSVVIPGAD